MSLPPSLLHLFAPRPPLPHLPPITSKKRGPPTITPAHNDFQRLLSKRTTLPEWTRPETWREERERRKREKMERGREKRGKMEREWDPTKIPSEEDPFATLFVSRLNYTTTVETLHEVFARFGKIAKINMIFDKEGKPRGYAFVTYENEKYMKAAYKEADGIKIDQKRVLVDVERGRTVKGWKPRRLGGGLGGTRNGGTGANIRTTGREGSRLLSAGGGYGASAPSSRPHTRDYGAPLSRGPPREYEPRPESRPYSRGTHNVGGIGYDSRREFERPRWKEDDRHIAVKREYPDERPVSVKREHPDEVREERSTRSRYDDRDVKDERRSERRDRGDERRDDRRTDDRDRRRR